LALPLAARFALGVAIAPPLTLRVTIGRAFAGPHPEGAVRRQAAFSIPARAAFDRDAARRSSLRLSRGLVHSVDNSGICQGIRPGLPPWIFIGHGAPRPMKNSRNDRFFNAKWKRVPAKAKIKSATDVKSAKPMQLQLWVRIFAQNRTEQRATAGPRAFNGLCDDEGVPLICPTRLGKNDGHFREQHVRFDL